MWSRISIFFGVLLWATFSFAQELRCQNGAIRWTELGESNVERREFCFNSDKTILTSPGCAKKACSVFYIEKKYKISELSSPVGKPGARLCRLLNGRVQIVSFSAGNTWFKLDRCLLNDGEFLDTGYLLLLLLEKPD